MTTDAKIGERLMLGLRGSEPGDPGLETDLAACASVGVRAVLLFDRDVASGRARNVIGRDQLRGLTAHIRSRLGADTIIAVDQEGGRVQRLGPDHGFAAHPSAAEFAGMPPRDRVAAADRLAAELADVGINLNLSPCVDIGDGSPVIGGLGRSFGGDPDAVVECASAVIVAHRGRGIGCALKHFPGHGSAPGDSHKTLPDITRSFDPGRDLAPYRALCARDGISVMTAHVLHRGHDRSRPASLSRPITTGLLREGMRFGGVIMTDSLDMEGVRRQGALEDVIAAAAGAGADLIVHACNSERAEHAPEVAAAAGAAAARLTADAEAFARLRRWRRELARGPGG